MHQSTWRKHSGVKFIYSYTTRQNERREGLTISAPNRDAAYSELNKRGIRPYKLHPAPGIWNKMSAIGGRGLTIVVLVLIVGVLVTIALNMHKDIVELEQDGDVREIVTGAITSKVRRQLIDKYSTGTIVLSGLIRLAFSTVPSAKLPELFANVAAAINDLRK